MRQRAGAREGRATRTRRRAPEVTGGPGQARAVRCGEPASRHRPGGDWTRGPGATALTGAPGRARAPRGPSRTLRTRASAATKGTAGTGERGVGCGTPEWVSRSLAIGDLGLREPGDARDCTSLSSAAWRPEQVAGRHHARSAPARAGAAPSSHRGSRPASLGIARPGCRRGCRSHGAGSRALLTRSGELGVGGAADRVGSRTAALMKVPSSCAADQGSPGPAAPRASGQGRYWVDGHRVSFFESVWITEGSRGGRRLSGDTLTGSRTPLCGSNRSQNDLLNHRPPVVEPRVSLCDRASRNHRTRSSPSLRCGGFEPVAERPPQPPVAGG